MQRIRLTFRKRSGPRESPGGFARKIETDDAGEAAIPLTLDHDRRKDFGGTQTMSTPTLDLPGAERPIDRVVELAQLRGPHAERLNGRTARSLVREGPLRVTLVALAPGGGMPRHEAPGPMMAQGVDGEVQFTVGERGYLLRPGQILSLGPHVPHSVESRTGGSFLLTVVLPPAAD